MTVDVNLATEWVKILGAIGVFITGLWQYTKAQRWKRREFIATQVKQFESDKKIQLAMTMLDWNNRELYFPSDTHDKSIALRVDTDLLCSALLPHEEAQSYSQEEEMIRDCFDHFLDMLGMFWNFIDARLISKAELEPYIQYWIRLVSGEMTGWHGPQLSYLLLNYIRVYNFTGAQRLIKRLGYDPQPSQAHLADAIKATLEKRPKHTWHSAGDHASKSPRHG